MTSLPSTSRRDLLKMVSGVPMLPLATTGASGLLLSACASTSQSGKSSPVKTVFESMAAPSIASDMATTAVGSGLSVQLPGGKTASYKLAYQSFFITGSMVSDGKGGQTLAGGYYDIHNRPIMDTSVAGKERHFFSDCPDGSTLITVPGARVEGVKGNPVFAVVQFEYASFAQDGKTEMYGKLPSTIAVLSLDQNPQTGELKMVKYHHVDTSSVHGLWITCGASLSPWGTHLSSEEYEPDAFNSKNAQLQAFSQNLYGNPHQAKPYHYGHLPEVTVNKDGTANIVKHYCLGRISHELVEVMPDNRTVLMGDDATNGGYFVFVADREKDLSSGTLYVARLASDLTSVDPKAAATGMQWIRLGSATSADIRKLADTLSANDIMQVTHKDPADASFTRIMMGGKVEWVKVKPGMEKAAAFLETHRYAALMGASMGFSKMEGTTVNAANKVAYSALSYCKDSMVAGHKKNMASTRVNLPKALNAGAVLALKLGGNAKDTQGHTIRSDWMPLSIQGLLTGEDLPKPDRLGNSAHADKIANPDNLKFSEKMRTLFIGEDSGMHVNNFLWAYNVDTGKLSRILSTPAGAESTGLHSADEVNGWTYILSNFQHPGEYIKTIDPSLKTAVDPLLKANYNGKFGAAVGYLTAATSSIRLG